MKTISEKIILAIAIVVAIVVAWTYFYRTEKYNQQGADRTAVLETDIATLAVNSNITTSAPASSTPTAGKEVFSGGLQQELENARNYRILFEALLQRKESGAGLYALNILVTCGRLQESIGLTSQTNSTAQDTARQLLHERCSSFTPEELSTQRTAQILTDARLKDNQKDLINQWGQVGSDENKKTELRSQILAQNSPLLLEFIGPWLYYNYPQSGLKDNDKTYPVEQASQVLSAAWSAAVCQGTSISCGRMDMTVVEACALKNICLEDRRTLLGVVVEHQFGADGLALYNSVYKKMVAAIQSKATSGIS